MLEGKGYRVLNAFFSFVFYYEELWFSYAKPVPLTTVHTTYISLVNCRMTTSIGITWTFVDLKLLRQAVDKLKAHVTALLSPHILV